MHALLIIGMIISFIGGIWLLVVAFQTSVWWGLGCFFLAPVSLIFVILHWAEAKKPFLISLAGTILVIIAVMNSKELAIPTAV